ncbi:MAG: hypothetical protein ACI4T1_03245 [Christensenellales bacterium]
MKKFKNVLVSITLICTIIFAGISIAGCKKNSKIYLNDVYAMGMVSAMSYLEGNSDSLLDLVSLNATSLSTPDTSTKETLTQYIKMFEGLLNYGAHPTESLVTEADGIYSEYAKKLSLNIGKENYVMYYNEVLEGTKEEVDEDEIEQETTTFLYGKAIRTSTEDVFELNVVGSRKIEAETERGVVETENELTLLFSTESLVATSTDSFDKIDVSTLSNYVMIEQETEDMEIEFEYTTKFGKDIKSVEVEWENKSGNEELEIEIEENNNQVEYKIKKSNDNKYEVRTNKNKFLFNIIKEDGEFKFVNKDGKEI